MFSTGSKLFLGATTIALIATLVVGMTMSGGAYWTAMVGLISATVALAFLTAINFFVQLNGESRWIEVLHQQLSALYGFDRN